MTNGESRSPFIFNTMYWRSIDESRSEKWRAENESFTGRLLSALRTIGRSPAVKSFINESKIGIDDRVLVITDRRLTDVPSPFIPPPLAPPLPSNRYNDASKDVQVLDPGPTEIQFALLGLLRITHRVFCTHYDTLVGYLSDILRLFKEEPSQNLFPSDIDLSGTSSASI